MRRPLVELPWSGLVAGALLAPFTAAGSFLRHSRVFHPRGVVLRGVAIPTMTSGPQYDVGARLAGPVIARFSGAWWKTHDWPDVLGCAIRFLPSDDSDQREAQDLLLATMRVPLTTLFAPLTTHVDDYLRNDYFGVSPFRVPPLGQVKLRLSPIRVEGSAPQRNARLAQAAHEAKVCFRLEARAAHLGAHYEAVALLELDEVDDVDQEALSFDPFNTGRDLHPVGFIHGLRFGAYAASRWARGSRKARPLGSLG